MLFVCITVTRPSIYPLYTLDALNRDHVALFHGYKEGPCTAFAPQEEKR